MYQFVASTEDWVPTPNTLQFQFHGFLFVIITRIKTMLDSCTLYSINIQRLMSDVHKKLEPVNSEIKILQRKMQDLEDNDLLTSSWESKTISEINSQKLELMRRIEKDSKVLTEKVTVLVFIYVCSISI